MKKVAVFALGMLLAGATSALAQDVRYNYDKQANFASFKTYKWVDVKSGKVNDINEKMIRAAVDAELGKKGLTKTEAATADLYVAYQAAVDTEKQYTSFDTGWGYGPGWYGGGWYGGGGGMTTGTTSTIYVGQLAIDMYQTSNKSLTWRGVVSKTLDAKAKPEKQEKNLGKAVAKLFKNYPPVEKKKK